VSYGGAFGDYVPLILRLHLDGKGPPEIAALAPPAGRPWLRSGEREPISPQMVTYILRQEGFEPFPRRWSEDQRQGFAAFKRRYEEWEAERRSRLRPRPGSSLFEAHVRGLYEVLSWMIGELEARTRKGVT
jgi:hypothetical protein